MVQCSHCIDYAAVEEKPACPITCFLAVVKRDLNGASREGFQINPRKGRPSFCGFLLHNAPTGLIERRVSPSAKLVQQR